MTNFKGISRAFSTGVFIILAWWVFVDGALTSSDVFSWFHIFPGFVIMFAMFAINMVSPNRIEQSGAVKLWLFLWFAIAMTCIGVAIWITSVEYPPNYNWPGVAIILQTIIIFITGVLFFASRKAFDSNF